MKSTRKVAALTGDGRIVAVEQPIPEVKPGTVLVEVHASLVSPGTELGGWQSLKAQREKPALLQKPRPFGYSNAGVVAGTGAGVQGLKVGDRIACIGAGFAQHADYAVVPYHLCVALPVTVTMAQGAYAMLAATALHSLRRAEPEFGEYCAIVGMGLVGQLAARLHQLAGNYVIGWDTIALRLKIARKWGVDATVDVSKEDAAAVTKQFTKGCGLDSAVMAFGGDGNKAMLALESCMKRAPDGHQMGRVVVVGGTRFEYGAGAITNMDIRRAGRTGAGYHDDVWEVGPDYPPVFMRWTTRTNLELCMRLIAERKLDVDCLTTHTIPLAEVEPRIAAIIDQPDDILGVVFTMKQEKPAHRSAGRVGRGGKGLSRLQ
jgi:threonine dehydrogenase-like Zn-dependent dehydrogenase